MGKVIYDPQGEPERESTFKNNLLDLPSGFSVELCKLVAGCLYPHPRDRLIVEEVGETARAQLAKLDTMYGAEIKKAYDEIAEAPKVRLPRKRGHGDFAIENKFGSLHKRRRIEQLPEGPNYNSYKALIQEWNVRPVPARPNVICREVMAEIRSTWNHRIVVEEPILDRQLANVPWHYFYSCVQKRVDWTEEVYVYENQCHVRVSHSTPSGTYSRSSKRRCR